ncbi:uncharacterized protein LOC134661855 [Cydia amplana]|uniref:uncharacterized protein LOC134661855 n=1 Tax=Cydia amplana TaxID=1869771 RepID=UPI002FE664B2
MSSAVSKLNLDLDQIVQWCKANNLVLNSSKSKLMLFGPDKLSVRICLKQMLLLLPVRPTQRLPASQPVLVEDLAQNIPTVQAPRPTPAQQSMNEFVHSMRPLGPRRAEKIDEQLIKMVAKGHHPFSLVEEQEFKTFVSMLCPGYSLPTRKTLSESLLPKMYKREMDKAKAKVEAGQAICLTTDGWMSDNNESFIAVTAHYIGADTKLESTMLGCVEYAERHTAANLAQFLKDITREWNFENKITAVASDNAANITAAIKAADWAPNTVLRSHIKFLRSKCTGRNGRETTARVKQIVEYFKRSSQALAKLKEIQKQLDVPLLKLKQDDSLELHL